MLSYSQTRNLEQKSKTKDQTDFNNTTYNLLKKNFYFWGRITTAKSEYRYPIKKNYK